MEADGDELDQHVHPVIVYAEICILICGGKEEEVKGKWVEDVFYIHQSLEGEVVDGHEHDIEVGHWFEEGDVGDEDLRMRPALLPQVEQTGDQQGDCVAGTVPKVEMTAVSSRNMSSI